MFNIHSVEIDWGGRPLRLQTGKSARQADGAVLATYGETVVLATVVAAKTPRDGVDFLPLTVDYQEKAYAAGRIPGGYFKREGRPTEKETLVSRSRASRKGVLFTAVIQGKVTEFLDVEGIIESADTDFYEQPLAGAAEA